MDKEYIERERAVNALVTDYAYAAADIVSKLPAADVAPVVHARWIYHCSDLFPAEGTQECSHCHEEEKITLLNENYCPNCGAIMDA